VKLAPRAVDERDDKLLSSLSCCFLFCGWQHKRTLSRTHILTRTYTHTHTWVIFGLTRIQYRDGGGGGVGGNVYTVYYPALGWLGVRGACLAHTHTHTHTHIFMYIHICIYIYIYIYMYIYVCIYIYMYISKYIYYLYVFIFNSINQFGRRWSLRRVLWTSATTRPLMWFSVLRLTHTYTHGWTFGFQANWFIKVPTVASGPSRRSAAGLRRRRTRRTS